MKEKLQDEDAYIYNESKKALAELAEIKKNITKAAVDEWLGKYYDLFSELNGLFRSGIIDHYDYSETSISLFHESFSDMTFDYDDIED